MSAAGSSQLGSSTPKFRRFADIPAPLFLQSIMAIKSALESNMAALHLFGKPAEGALARPFKAAPGLMDQFMGGGGAAQTDAASIKSAEKVTGKKTQ